MASSGNFVTASDHEAEANNFWRDAMPHPCCTRCHEDHRVGVVGPCFGLGWASLGVTQKANPGAPKHAEAVVASQGPRPGHQGS